MNNKKLVRPRNGRKISGVCLGIAEYFGIDVTVIRVLWVLGTLLFLGTGIILYSMRIYSSRRRRYNKCGIQGKNVII